VAFLFVGGVKKMPGTKQDDTMIGRKNSRLLNYDFTAAGTCFPHPPLRGQT